MNQPRITHSRIEVDCEKLSTNLSKDLKLPDPSHGLCPNIEAQAISFVLAHYVIDSAQDTGQGYFEYLPILFVNGSADDLIQTSVVAIGMAGLSNIAHSERMMSIARRLYVDALRMTNNALQSVSTAKSDSTLIAIMLLTKFELITFEAEGSQESWKKHVNGASMLLQLRGKGQLQTWLGLRLFMQLKASILLNCLWHKIPVPEVVLELRAEARQIRELGAPIYTITSIMIKFVNAFLPLKARKAPPTEIIPIMVQLDHEAQALAEVMAPKWQYETFYTSADSDLAYKGYYHKYRDQWCAWSWNVIRCLRVFMNSIIQRSIRRIHTTSGAEGDAYTTQLEASSNNLIQMAIDICATVPQHAGYLRLLFTQSAERKQEMGNSTSDRELKQLFDTLEKFDFPIAVPAQSNPPEALPAAGCIFLIGPLRIAGRVPLASEEMRTWIVKRLRWIASTMGIQQALVFANDIEETIQNPEVCSQNPTYRTKDQSRRIESNPEIGGHGNSAMLRQ